MGCCQPMALHLRPEWNGCIPNLHDNLASAGDFFNFSAMYTPWAQRRLSLPVHDMPSVGITSAKAAKVEAKAPPAPCEAAGLVAAWAQLPASLHQALI